MAESTFQKRGNDIHENDNNKKKQNLRFQNLIFPKLSKSVMQNASCKTTLNSTKRRNKTTYSLPYNVLSVLFQNIFLLIFWTLCQQSSCISLASSVSDPVISTVTYVGYLERKNDRTTFQNQVNEIFLPKSIDVLINVKGNNIEKIDNWKATKNVKSCNDTSNDAVSKMKHISVMPSDEYDENVEVLLPLKLQNLNENKWYLCIKNDLSKIDKTDTSDQEWLHLGPALNFRLPIEELSEKYAKNQPTTANQNVFTGQDKEMSNKKSQLTRVQRSPQNKEVDGNESETMINQSETNSLVSNRKSRIVSMRLTKTEKDKIFYEESGLITLQQGLVVEDLMLYGWGLTNDTSVKFTSSSGEFGANCKTNDKMHITGHKLPIVVTDEDGTVAKVTIPSDELIVFGEDNSYFICLSSGDSSEEFIHQGEQSAIRLEIIAPFLPIWLMIILLIILLCLSGLFSGLNLGLMALDQTELKIVQNTGSEKEKRYAKAIVPVRAHGNFLLCSLLLGNVLVNSTLTIFMEALSSGLVAVIGSTMGIVIFGEIIPQALCSRHALFVGASTIWLTKFFMVLTFPLSFPISLILDKILGDELGTVYDKKKLIELLRVTNENNDLEKDEVDIVTGALVYKEKTVKHIMTAIQDCYMLPLKSFLNFETVSEIREQGYSRIPVYDGDRNNILHILFAKDLMFIDPDDNMPLAMVCEFYNNEVNFVYADTPLNIMFNEFKSGEKGHMAFVQDVNATGEGDPFHETIGLVTLEDIIEEIIQQEIVDETDVVLDNRTKKKRKGKNKEIAVGSNFPVMAGDTAKRIRISPQVTLAVFQYLTTSIEPFKNEFLAKVVLEKLLTLDIYREVKIKSASKMNNSDEELILVRKGKPINYFILIIEGRVEVNIGREELQFESGPFSYFGIQTLTQALPSTASGLPTDSPSSPNVAIKNVGGNSVHSAISNRTESEHTLPAIGGTKASESGDTGVGVKSVSSYLRKGSTQISLESPANALIGNAANANKRGSSGTAGSGDPGNSNYTPFVPDYTIKAVADCVYAKITRATYLRALKASKMARKQSISSEMIDKHLDENFLDRVNEDDDSSILVTQGTPLQLRSPDKTSLSQVKDPGADKTNATKKPINVYTNPANGPVSLKLEGGPTLTVSGASSDCDGISDSSSSRLMGGQDSNNSSFRNEINPNVEKDKSKDYIEDNNDKDANNTYNNDSNPKTDSGYSPSDVQHANELEQKGDSRSCLLENRDKFGAS